jgi:hypothetical protein
MIFLRRIFMCWWGGCGGTIEGYFGPHLCWQCKTCKRVFLAKEAGQ